MISCAFVLDWNGWQQVIVCVLIAGGHNIYGYETWLIRVCHSWTTLVVPTLPVMTDPTISESSHTNHRHSPLCLCFHNSCLELSHPVIVLRRFESNSSSHLILIEQVVSKGRLYSDHSYSVHGWSIQGHCYCVIQSVLDRYHRTTPVTVDLLALSGRYTWITCLRHWTVAWNQHTVPNVVCPICKPQLGSEGIIKWIRVCICH